MLSLLKWFSLLLVLAVTAVCLATVAGQQQDSASQTRQIRVKREDYCGRNQPCGWQDYDKHEDTLHPLHHNPDCHCRRSQKCLKGDFDGTRYVYKCWKPRS